MPLERHLQARKKGDALLVKPPPSNVPLVVKTRTKTRAEISTSLSNNQGPSVAVMNSVTPVESSEDDNLDDDGVDKAALSESESEIEELEPGALSADVNDEEDPSLQISFNDFFANPSLPKMYVKSHIKNAFPGENFVWEALDPEFMLESPNWVQAPDPAEIRVIHISRNGLAKSKVSNLVNSTLKHFVLISKEGTMYALASSSDRVSNKSAQM